MQFDRQKAARIAPAVRMLLKENDSIIVTFKSDDSILESLKDEQAFLAVSGINTVYIPECSDENEQYDILKQRIEAYKKENNKLPTNVAVQNLGIYYVRSNDTAGKGRLNDKIVIVTGSAQGFGKGIAEEMAKEGANIVFADLNEELARKNAENICNQYGKDKAIAVKVDVSNEESVNNMMIETVLAYGGIDVFVNNAGVLRAGGLDEMDLKTFEFVTKVNYTAYFICTKYVSEYMKIQNRFDKKYFMDIIQINSKSGLEGSNKNFAYAGGKFGGIGLTQSFAKELVEYNIKVNAVCPGNFFDGPLWSDPENGLFVQYLRAGKVPGAKTIQDVKDFYESKVPMGRGCEVMDVVRAILYIIEQQYETGQALPVTGGQIMLN